jgi:hypothetical protein
MVGAINTTLGFFKRDYLLTNANLRSIRIVNNILYDGKSPSVIIPHGRKNDGSSSWDAPESQVVFDYNVVARGSKSARFKKGRGFFEIAAFGRRWENVEQLSGSTAYKHNRSATPEFASPSELDFRLILGDRVARNAGKDLSGLELPGLEVDLCGNRRGADGHWDIGALETPEVHLSRNDAGKGQFNCASGQKQVEITEIVPLNIAALQLLSCQLPGARRSLDSVGPSW